MKLVLYNFSEVKYNPGIEQNTQHRKEPISMKKIISMMLVIILTMSLFTACGASKSDSDLAAIQKKGKIVVGITDYAPMDYKDENGEWTGFDAEFAQLFAKELGVDCEFYVIADWGKKFLELETK